MNVWFLAAILSAAPTGLDEGRAAFEQGDFERALERLDQAAFEARDDATRAQIHLLRAQCFGTKRQWPKVDEAFAMALHHDPEAHLDPKRVLPALVKRLDELRGKLTGQLELAASAVPATLSVDGAALGPSPQTVRLPIGRHRVAAEASDGRRIEREVIVRPEDPQVVALTFEARAASPSPQPEASLWPEASIQANIDPTAGVGLEAAASLGARYWAASVRLLGGGGFGVGLRASARAPRLWRFTFYGAVDGQLFLTPLPVPAVGVSGGFAVEVWRFFAPFAEVGGRWTVATAQYKSSYLLLAVGLSFAFR